MEVVSKPLMGRIDPLTLTFWRFVGGAAVLWGTMFFRRGARSIRSLPPKTLGRLILMGAVNIALAMSLLQTAVKFTSASKAATIFCANPVLVYGIALITGTEKHSLRKIAGLSAGLIGLGLVGGFHPVSPDPGTVFALLSAAAFALYTVLGRKASLSADPVTVNALSFTAGLLVLLPVLIISRRPLSPAPLLYPPGTLGVFAYLAVGVSGIAYITFIRAIRRMGAVAASMVFMLKPAVAALLARAFLGDTHTPSFWAGLFLVSSGSFLVVAGRKSTVGAR